MGRIIARYFTCCGVSLHQTLSQHVEMHDKLRVKRRRTNYALGKRNKNGSIPTPKQGRKGTRYNN